MLQSSNLLVLVVLAVLAGTSYAVFYTKSTDNEYPRIGRRSFYTTGTSYPRIGRRDSAGRYLTGAAAAQLSPDDTPTDWAGAAFDKRGVFTASGGYPRVGRSGQQSLWRHMRSNLLRAALAAHDNDSDDNNDDDEGDNGGLSEDLRNDRAEERQGSRFQLELMFVAFDENGDTQLSKEEFTKGMEKYRGQSPLC